ncbi:hypothetical protein CO725_24360 [Vibrio parahaemolyticus]|uniref:hypothetical protein n=1 Tax=Vibrio parahaemolyticus TaxID=670 RepID=UPI000BE3C296|nr:hypothetical protein [Vibrio parahaemolyticus]ATI48558.1 hypothetical protein CO725_24360 [Vibrio parahaemolyticus]
MSETMLTISDKIISKINYLNEIPRVEMNFYFLCLWLGGAVIVLVIYGISLKRSSGEIEESEKEEVHKYGLDISRCFKCRIREEEVHSYDLDNDQLIINLESYNKEERLIVISEVCNVLRKENNNESTIENE